MHEAIVDTSTVDGLLEAVREIEPVIRDHAAEAEQNRRLSTPAPVSFCPCTASGPRGDSRT